MTIQTKQLELSIETEKDIESVYGLLSQIYPPEFPPVRENLQEEQRFYILMRKGMFGGYFGRWLVKRKSNNPLIGLGYIMPHLCTPEENAALPNSHPNRFFEVEVGWVVAPKFRNQRFGSEIGRALCQYAFESVNVQRVIGITGENNPASIRVMERTGMKIVYIPRSSGVLGWVTQNMFQANDQ